jgi:hypothetical protein
MPEEYMTMRYYSPGDIVVIRDMWNGKLFFARPVRVVEDTPDMLALFTAPETRWKLPRGTQRERITARDLKEGSWSLEDAAWTGLGTLSLTIPGSHFSVWLFWHQVLVRQPRGPD